MVFYVCFLLPLLLWWLFRCARQCNKKLQGKEEEGDPSEFEKKKDHYNIYENEIIPKDKTDDNIKGYSQFDGLNEDWEDFNERDFDKV